MGCIPYEKTARYLVPEWQSEHPEGLAKDCAKDLNISLTLVYDFWTSKKKRKSSKEIQECVYEYLEKNPNATVEECCRELDISKSSFSKYKALWKLQKDILKESK